MEFDNSKLLSYSFYKRDTATVAQELLGKYMVYRTDTGEAAAGKVVETEAYLGKRDPSCHSARGKTKRNSVMFGPCGRVYIYVIYGIHLCFNVTTSFSDKPEAVLIRALEPVEGIGFMKNNRNTNDILNLCSGPGKLVQAMGVKKDLNGTSVVEGPVKFYEGVSDFKIAAVPRIGISQAADWPLRFYMVGSKYISKK